jgi:hypothetical protein
MGIFYRTVFFKNISNKQDFIVLRDVDQVIDMHEMERGFIIKEELLKHFMHLINAEDISDDSRVVEYISSTYDDLSLIENVNLFIR